MGQSKETSWPGGDRRAAVRALAQECAPRLAEAMPRPKPVMVEGVILRLPKLARLARRPMRRFLRRCTRCSWFERIEAVDYPPLLPCKICGGETTRRRCGEDWKPVGYGPKKQAPRAIADCRMQSAKCKMQGAEAE